MGCYISSPLTIVGGVDVVSPPLWRHVASPLRRQGVLEVLDRKLTQGCCLLSKQKRQSKTLATTNELIDTLEVNLNTSLDPKTQIYLSELLQSKEVKTKKKKERKKLDH